MSRFRSIGIVLCSLLIVFVSVGPQKALAVSASEQSQINALVAQIKILQQILAKLLANRAVPDSCALAPIQCPVGQRLVKQGCAQWCVIGGAGSTRSFPTVQNVSLPSTGLTDGRLLRFSVSAHVNGPIGLAQMGFAFNGVATDALAQVDLYAFTDNSYQNPVPGLGYGGYVGSTAVSGAGGPFKVSFTKPLEVPAGRTYYFELRDSGKGTTLVSGTRQLTVSLASDSVTQGRVPAAAVAGNFIWSPNSLGTASAFEEIDWTNGSAVSGLREGISETRSRVDAAGAPQVSTFTVSGGGVVNPGQVAQLAYTTIDTRACDVLIANSASLGHVAQFNSGSYSLLQSTPAPNGQLTIFPSRPDTLYILHCVGQNAGIALSALHVYTSASSTPVCNAPHISGVSPVVVQPSKTLNVTYNADQSVKWSSPNLLPWAQLLDNTLHIGVATSGVGTFVMTIFATNSCGLVDAETQTVTRVDPSATVDSPSAATSTTPLLYGTVKNISTIGIGILDSAGVKIYGSGRVDVVGGQWRIRVGTALAPGNYTVNIYSYFDSVIIGSGTLSIPAPVAAYSQGSYGGGDGGGSGFSGGGDGDIADWYEATSPISPGTIVAVTDTMFSHVIHIFDLMTHVDTGNTYTIHMGKVAPATYDQRQRVIGAVATAPSVMVGVSVLHDAKNPVPVGIGGHIPVRISLENGAIRVGDPITISRNHQGVGMRATETGRVIGYSLENYSDPSQSDGDGMIEVTINVHDWAGLK